MRVAVAVLMLVLAVPAQGAPQRRASLKLESLAPLVVRGTQFGFRESVAVTYLGPDQSPRTVGARSSRDGRFEASFEFAARPLRRLHRSRRRDARQPRRAPGRASLQAEAQGPAEAGPCDPISEPPSA